MKSLFAVLLVSTGLTAVTIHAQVPQIINYQGRVSVNGTNFTGTGQFKFALVNASGSATYWSNGVNAVSVSVTNGLYAVLLGDTTVANMAQGIAPSAFTNSDVRLRVWFNDGVSGLQQLSPDQRVGAVGYALNAAQAQSAVNILPSSDVTGRRLNIGVGNNVSGTLATVAGGSNNTANSYSATVGGGRDNVASGNSATVGGGVGNVANDYYAIVGGGLYNIATNDYTAVGGGISNVAGGLYATVGGGESNTAGGFDSTVGGGRSNLATNTWTTVAGGGWNAAVGWGSTVGGGYLNLASGSYSAVAGGSNNLASAAFAAIAGGYSNAASSSAATVGGGYGNTASGAYAAIGGGYGNLATYSYATVGGGLYNVATNYYATVGGGAYNAAGYMAKVGGGSGNVANGDSAVVGGGADNVANGVITTVGGGYHNEASGSYSTIGGGALNLASGLFSAIAGGYYNTASGTNSFVGGGSGNSATKDYATVPGGSNNVAVGRCSFAAGRGAKANHNGAFVWADNASGDFASTGTNQFLVRASGGVGIGMNNPAQPLHVRGNVQFDKDGAIPGELILQTPVRNDPGRFTLKFANNIIAPITGDDTQNIQFEFYSVFGKARTNDAIVHVHGKAANSWGTYLELTHDGTNGVVGTDVGHIVLSPAQNVGIGTSTPGYKLEVNGSVAGVGAYQSVSDARYKRDVRPLTEALATVERLRGVRFKWREDEYPDLNFEDDEQVGFLAQEVEPVLPEVVNKDAGGHYSLAYSKLVPVLVEAIKEQQKELDRIPGLEKRLAELERKLAEGRQ